jgi:hypothetical protein
MYNNKHQKQGYDQHYDNFLSELHIKCLQLWSSDWTDILATPHNLKGIEFVNIYCSLLFAQHIFRGYVE